MQPEGRLVQSAPEEITVPISWMPSLFAKPKPAQQTGDILPPVSAAAPAASVSAAQNRSVAGGVRAASDRFMHALKMQANGGAGARTRSYTPFTSRTTSAKLQPSPQLHNSDSPRKPIEDARMAPRPSVGQHEQATRASLGGTFKADPALQRLRNVKVYRDIVNARVPAVPARNDKARKVLLQVLDEIGNVPGMSGTKAGTLQGIGMAWVAEAALRACADEPAAAARALCCLRNIDLLASIRHVEAMPDSVAKPKIPCPEIGAQGEDRLFHFDEDDLSLAWKIAQELEATPAGFAALKALTQHSRAAAGTHPSIERHDDAMLHAYLQASRVKCGNADPEHGAGKKGGRNQPVSAAPHRIAAPGGESPNVLDKAIVQIRRHLAASHEHCREKPNMPFAYQAQPHEHEWALGFIRNGLYTDETSVDGKPTAYAQIEGRLNKVAVWCERATSGKDAASTAWRAAAPYLMPGYRKSPLNAYNALEAEQGLRQCGVGLENSAQGVIHDARAFKEHILGNLIKGLKSCGGIDGGPLGTLPGSHPRDLARETMNNLARLAVLMETVNSKAPFTAHLHGDAPDTHTIDQARRRLHSWLAEGDGMPADASRAAVEAALSAAARPLTMDRLQAWADALPKAPARAAIEEAAHSMKTGTDRPDWDAFASAAEQVRNGAGKPVPAPHFRRLGDASAKLDRIGEVVEGVAARMELGSRISFTSGGFVGAGAREVTQFLGSVFSLGLLRPRADASAVRKREAVLEMETSAGGNGIFVGTRRSLKAQGGGGIGVEPGMKLKGVAGVKAGASFDAFVSKEQPATRGVQLRLSRSQSGMAGDRDNNLLLGRLFRTYVIERNSPALKQNPGHVRAPGKDGDSTLKNLLQACPQLNVCLLKTTESLVRTGISASAGASVNAGPLCVGPSVGISYEQERTKTLKWAEPQAGLNVMKSGRGVKRTAALTGQMHALRQMPEAARTLSGPGTLPARLEQTAGGLMKAMCVTSEEIGSWGKAGNYTLVIENGEIVNGSRATVTHRDAASFIASVAPKLDRWAICMAQRFQKDKLNPGAGDVDVYRQEAYDRAYATLSAQLEDARTNGNLQTRYIEVFELNDDALETANALRSAIALFERSGDKEKAAVYSKKLDALLASDEAWMPHLLWTQRTTRREATAGMRFGLYAGKTDMVSSSSIKMLG